MVKKGNKAPANVLFLYGPSGAGKTRLLQMIEESCRQPTPMRLGCEQIADEMIRSFQEHNFTDFFDRYSRVKTLLPDNLWILQRLPMVVKEMRRLIAARVAQGNLTVLASDLPYEDVPDILPAIAECLKEHDVVHLRLGARETATKPLLVDLLRCSLEDVI